MFTNILLITITRNPIKQSTQYFVFPALMDSKLVFHCDIFSPDLSDCYEYHNMAGVELGETLTVGELGLIRPTGVVYWGKQSTRMVVLSPDPDNILQYNCDHSD